MNWVLIIVLAVLAASAISGYNKGALRIAYSLVSWIIMMVFVAFATPHINLYLLENTSVYEKIEAHCEEMVRQSATESAESAQMENSQELTEQSDAELQLGDLEMNIPASMLEGIMEKTAGATETFLEESGVYTKLAGELANFFMKGISFLIALVAAWLLACIISQMIGIASRIPVIKGVNRLFGLVVGTFYGLLFVWIGFYITALMSASEKAQVIVSYIYENPFLTFLYENNLVLTFILKYF